MDNKKVEAKYVIVPTEAPKMSTSLVVRTILYLVVIINSLAAFFGFDINLSVDENMVYEAVTIIADLVAFGSAYWKNNDITKQARIKAEAAKQVVKK